MWNNRERQYVIRTIFLLTFLLSVQGELSFETLIRTGDEIIFPGNITLIVEDVDPQSGILWIKLFDENGTIKSEILRVGDRFTYEEGGVNFTITKIYAGGEKDLVVLMITGNEIAVLSAENFSDGSTASETSPGFEVLQITILAAALIVRRLLKAA